ncbi:Catabolite control protein A [Calidithermus terrae]|uniref:Catabolite control protein A n=1 Tax=Calidithermus terrae TaxID=1408545 RepID=A0A399F2Y9_9DEIN|nr:LacI family DNA-binding transcriptional regulator [Calidithermus terrae]RIH90463.1 Catabolite control protein A [Calidithermus terrae]
MSRKRIPTIHDVARLAGVSTGTVSRALNARSGVHPVTRQRVMEAVNKLGYVPSVAARELAGRTEAVGVMVTPRVWKYSPYFILLFEALDEALWQEGYKLVEVPMSPSGEPLQPAAGYIVLGAHDHDPRLERMRQKHPNSVLVGVHPGMFWVAPDDPGGAYAATQHLLELGHRDVAHLGAAGQVGRERFEGYRQALTDYAVPYRPELVLNGAFTTLPAYRAVRRAWEGGLRFSGLFAASDEMALGAIAALEDLGLDVPHDVSVVGFDDLPDLERPLTTVRQEIPAIAKAAVALLKEATSHAPPRGVRVGVQLVVRDTTARRR